MILNVKDYGACGDGVTKDTDAVQKAVDACCAEGGGTVLFPNGAYLCGEVILKDNVTINIESGAEILASTEHGDYERFEATDEQSQNPYLRTWGAFFHRAVFYANGASNICIAGQGKISMRDKCFFDEDPSVAPRWMSRMREHKRWKPHKFRPRPISMLNCTNVTVKDIKLCDSPAYAMAFLACSQIRVQNVEVLSDPGCINTDGIHLCSCRNIYISGCYFRCGDDCIAIDPNYGLPCENAVISDCIFFTSVNVFRIFTGLEPAMDAPGRKPIHHEMFSKGLVRNINISNCVVEKSAGGFNITADAGTIDGVYVQNITGDINDMDTPFFMITMDGGTIRNVKLADIYARCTGGGVIAGDRSGAISDVTLSNIKYEISPTSKLLGNGLPDPILHYWSHNCSPYYLFVRHVDNLRLSTIKAAWGKADIADIFEMADPASRPSWANDGWNEDMEPKTSWPFMRAHDVDGLIVSSLECAPFGDSAAAVELKKVSNCVVSGSIISAPESRAFRLAECTNIEFYANIFASS